MPASKRKFVESEKNVNDETDGGVVGPEYSFSVFDRKAKKVGENTENDPNADNHSTSTASPGPCQRIFYENSKLHGANESNENNNESDSTTSSQTSTSMGLSVKRLCTESSTIKKAPYNQAIKIKEEMTGDRVNGVDKKEMDYQLSKAAVNQRIHEKEENEKEYEAKLNKMKEAVTTLLECIGEDPTRNGLLDTPLRVSKALLYMTKGYEQSLKGVVGNGIFDEDHSEMVIVRDIDIFSLCEHHMVPFIGKVHIGYIPKSKVLGLSKLARIADMFSRRLQVQERLTKQIAEAIEEAISPLGVAVVIESSHMCMVMRGVEKSGSSTITSSVTGCFKSSATRNEFFSLIGHQRIMR